MPAVHKIEFCSKSFLLGGILPVLLLVSLGHSPFEPAPCAQSLPPDASESDKFLASGPWGEIDALGFPLANCDGKIPDQAERLKEPRWVFEKFSEVELTTFLKSCDLTRAQKRILLNRDSWTVLPGACVIYPPQHLVWSLSSRSRRQIYSMLARSPANYCQRFPFRFPLNGFDSRLKSGGLAAQDVERLKRFTYIDGGTVCFTDLELAECILAPAQFKKLVETIYQIPVYRLRLRVSPDSDVEELVRYWGKGGREKLVEPLLKALTKVPEGAALNISALLPPFARLRLYTYPASWNDPDAASMDCMFSSMNFFRTTPDTNLFDRAYAQEVLASDYVPVDGRPTFGDLITVADAKDKIVHMCVYIAGDFVFTKNGFNLEEPWVLMRMSDIRLLYRTSVQSSRLITFRHKAPGASPQPFSG